MWNALKPEVKWRVQPAIYSGTIDSDPAGEMTLLTSLAQGDGVDERIGRQVRLRALKLYVQLNGRAGSPEPDPETGSVTPAVTHFRVVVLQSREPHLTGLYPSGQLIFDQTMVDLHAPSGKNQWGWQTTAQYQYNDLGPRFRFRVLMDRKYKVLNRREKPMVWEYTGLSDPNNPAGTAQTLTVQGGSLHTEWQNVDVEQKRFMINLDLKRCRDLVFAGDAAEQDYDQGHLFFGIWADPAWDGATVLPSAYVDGRLLYTDA